MTVNNVNALPGYTSGRADASGSMSDENTAGSFEQIMAKVNGRADASQTGTSNSKSPAVQTVVPAAVVKQDSTTGKADVQGANKAGRADNTIREESDGNAMKNTEANAKTDSDKVDAVSEEVQKSGEKLVQEIAEEMNVTPEEVEEAMAVLGLTAVQLFDADNLKQLLLAISGNVDELSLLTDETLYSNLQDLLGIVEESLTDLQEELGLSDEELDTLLRQMMSEQEMNVEESLPELETPETNLEGMKDYTVSVQRDGETVQMKVTVNDESGNKSVQESVTATPVREAQSDQRAQDKDTSANNGREGRESHTAQAFLQTTEAPTETSAEAEPVNVEYRSIQTEDIMNQIVEYMKINVKADTQSMEMQLHPASLGTLGIQIVAKDGVMTAHFTTQNEAVRAIVETQLIQLKNQFEEQGIKVDAVEVTVANHAYGQQYSQDGDNAEQGQAKSRKGRRQINLDQLGEDEELEELEDSERIAVEMMQANGSTVDYTA